MFIMSFFQVAHKIGEEQIKIWDESSSARNSVEMLHSGNYLFATIDGKPDYYDVKPPLQLWLKVMSFKVFGINEFAVRVPTLISYFLLTLLLFFFANIYLKNSNIGIILVILPAISYGFVNYHMAWHGDTDILLTLFTTSYLLLAFVFLEEFPKHRLGYVILLSFLVSTAYFTKSIAGIAPAIGIVIYALIKRRKVFTSYVSYLPVVIFILSLVIYYFVVDLYAPGYFKSIINNHLMPFKEYPTAPKHPEFSFYFNYLLNTGFYPFSYWLPIIIIPLIFSKNKQLKNFLIYLLITSSAFLIGQSSALMKNEWYIAPIYPLLWLIIAVSIYETSSVIKARLFPKSKAFVILYYALLISGLYVSAHGYHKVLDHNINRSSSYIYTPERDGEFLNSIFIWNPNINNIFILKKKTDFSDRQLDFYIKKFRYFNNKNIQIIRKTGDEIIDKYVLCTVPTLIRQLQAEYETMTIYKEHYGSLLYIRGDKLSHETDMGEKMNPELINKITNDFLNDKKTLPNKIKLATRQGHDLEVILWKEAVRKIKNDSVLIE